MPAPKIDFQQLIRDMAAAAQNVLKRQWKEAKPFAEMQLKIFAQNLELISTLKRKGKISEEKARLHLDIQKESFRTVLLTIEGIGLVTAENAINAALDVVRDTVNKAIGWTLL